MTAYKRNILNFCLRFRATAIASVLFFAILWTTQVLKSEEDGMAMASPASYADIIAAAEKAKEQKNIRALRQDIAANPAEILQLTGGDVVAMLEMPELVRVDLPTVVWQYRTKSCVLDLYFTSMDQKPEKALVSHYELRPRAVKRLVEKDAALTKSDTDCMQDIASAPGLMKLVNLR